MSEWTIWDITENPDKAERAIREIRGWRNATQVLKRQRGEALEQAARSGFEVDTLIKLIKRISVECGDVLGDYGEAG